MVKIHILRLYTANLTRTSKDDSLADCPSSKSEPNLMDLAAPAFRLLLGRISLTKPSKFLELMCSSKTFKSKDLEIKYLFIFLYFSHTSSNRPSNCTKLFTKKIDQSSREETGVDKRNEKPSPKIKIQFPGPTSRSRFRQRSLNLPLLPKTTKSWNNKPIPI